MSDLDVGHEACNVGAGEKHVAIYGGSFNPPHIGHQMVALWVLETVEVDEIWWVPSYQHPFGKQLAPFDARVAMCRLATEALGTRAVVSEIERRPDGSGTTYDLVDDLKKLNPNFRFSIVVGSDLKREIGRWYRGQELQDACGFIWVERQEKQNDMALDRVAMPDVSSSDIRNRLRSGREVEGLMSRRVVDFVRKCGLYVGTGQ